MQLERKLGRVRAAAKMEEGPNAHCPKDGCILSCSASPRVFLFCHPLGTHQTQHSGANCTTDSQQYSSCLQHQPHRSEPPEVCYADMRRQVTQLSSVQYLMDKIDNPILQNGSLPKQDASCCVNQPGRHLLPDTAST